MGSHWPNAPRTGGAAHVGTPYCSLQQGREERKGEGDGQTPMGRRDEGGGGGGG